MTYWNPVDKYGADAFARDLASAGGAGLITPDLTPEEAGPWLAASDHHHLDRVFLVAPSSTPTRIEQITKLCRGFVYAVSLMGITGTKEAVSSVAGGTVAGSASTPSCRSRSASASTPATRRPRWPPSPTA